MKKRFVFCCVLTCLGLLSFGQDDLEWDDYFMPGIGYKVYAPKNDSLGVYQGIMTEFVIYSRAKGSGSRKTGPTRIKTYGDLSIIKSDKEGSKDIFYSNFGLNLSFEGKTNRKYLIPYFGIELGGMFQRDFSTFQFSPITGIQIISTPKIIWSVQGGYQYTTQRFDELSGYIGSTSLNVLLWNN